MKKITLSVAAVLCIFSIFPADPALAADAEKTVTVFAAASMTESMNQIAGLYKKAAPNVTVVYNFDSSGTLKTQIQQGAECDIFISAGQRQMDQIDITASASVNTEKLDFVLPGTRFDIVANQVVLVVPKGKNPNGIGDFRDVVTDKVSIVALGNSDVPVGQYSQEIYTNLGIWEQLNGMSKITFASNVREVLVQVAAGAVDCGVVYSTDAATSDGVEVVAPAPADSHKPITYPAAILKRTKDEAAAKAFVEFLKGDAATGVFKSIGFAIPAK
ncbi:MAG: molybdate ABC transporter substrate-binding protein [Synergistaceae bacterium]|jgi:molybdate transport system substrate-binding protein|nr:molybdate ABC transporter substrate-binding protein [Synergistaceae bacterium]